MYKQTAMSLGALLDGEMMQAAHGIKYVMSSYSSIFHFTFLKRSDILPPFFLYLFRSMIMNYRKDVEKCAKVRNAVKDAIVAEALAAKTAMLVLIVGLITIFNDTLRAFLTALTNLTGRAEETST